MMISREFSEELYKEHIQCVHCFTAADGVLGAERHGLNARDRYESFDKLVFCVMVLRNGTLITGECKYPCLKADDEDSAVFAAVEMALYKLIESLGLQDRLKVAG